MTPEFFALYGELCLWHGDYQKTVNVILNTMNAKFASTVNDATQYMHNVKLTGTYSKIWDNTNPQPQETVSAIIYNYQGNQTNSLLKHFGTESPNEYLLAPSQVGMDRYTDPDFNPLGGATSDKRSTLLFCRKIKVVIMLSRSIVRQIAQRVPMLIKMMCIFIFIVAVSCISCWRRLSIIWDV